MVPHVSIASSVRHNPAHNPIITMLYQQIMSLVFGITNTLCSFGPMSESMNPAACLRKRNSQIDDGRSCLYRTGLSQRWFHGLVNA